MALRITMPMAITMAKLTTGRTCAEMPLVVQGVFFFHTTLLYSGFGDGLAPFFTVLNHWCVGHFLHCIADLHMHNVHL